MIETVNSTDRILPPDQCGSDQLEAFRKLVTQGGQVRQAGLLERIAEAHLLAFHYEGNELAGVAALKRPTEKYRDKIFRKAETTLPAGPFKMELGWVFTVAKFRGGGIGRRLLERLLERAKDVRLYATTHDDNDPMKKLLESLGFEQTGRAFFGTNGEEVVRLWVKCSSLFEP